jgi:hypothetical protein
MAGIEEGLDEAEIRELRDEAKELVEQAALRTNDMPTARRPSVRSSRLATASSRSV